MDAQRKVELVIQVIDADKANAKIAALEEQLKALQNQTGKTGNGYDKMVSGFTSNIAAARKESMDFGWHTMAARESLRGISEEMGIRMPRFVSSFIANLGGVSSALSEAFSTIAVVGFTVIAGEALARFVVALANYRDLLLEIKNTAADVFHPFAAGARDVTNENIDAGSKKTGELILASQERQRALKAQLAVAGLSGGGEIAAGLSAQIAQIRHEGEKTGAPIAEVNKEIALARQIAGQKEVEARRGIERQIDDLQQAAIVNRLEFRQKEIAEANVADNKELADAREQLKRKAITQDQFDRLRLAQAEATAGKVSEINSKYERESSAALFALREAGMRNELEASKKFADLRDKADELSLEAAGTRGNKYKFELAKIVFDEQKQVDELNRLYGDDERNYAALQSAKASLDQVAAQGQKEVVKSYGRELESIYDRITGGAKSATDVLKNIFHEFADYMKHKVFDQIAAGLLGIRQAGASAGTGSAGMLGSLGSALAGIAPVLASGGTSSLPALATMAGPGGTGGFAGPVLGAGASSSGGSSAASVLGLAGWLANLKKFAGIGQPVWAGGIGPQIGNILHSDAAALGGGLLAMNGLQRGGVGGLLETTAGGALIGFKYGGPVGALIGAAAGAVAGTIRLFIKSFAQQVRQRIRETYGVDIKDKGVLAQIVEMIKQQYGGSIALGINSPQLRELIQLYGFETKQQARGLRPPMQAFGGVEAAGGTVFALPSYLNGIPSGTIDRIGPGAASSAGPAAGLTIVVQNSLPADKVGAYMRGEIVTTVTENPRVVSTAALKGYSASASRRKTVAATIAPGTLV